MKPWHRLGIVVGTVFIDVLFLAAVVTNGINDMASFERTMTVLTVFIVNIGLLADFSTQEARQARANSE